MAKLPPLTDEEIRSYLLQISNGMLGLGLAVKTLENLLLRKGLVTTQELDEVIAQSIAEAQGEAAKQFLAAIHLKPGEGVQ